LSQKQMNSIDKTETSFSHVLKINCTEQCDRKIHEVTRVSHYKELDTEELDIGIAKTADSLEELLVRFLLILNDRHSLQATSQHIEELLKRYILAVVAVSYIDETKLDSAVTLNLHLPTLPTDGVDDLLHTVDDIRDFYSCVNDPTTATPTVEVFTLDVRQS